MPHLIIFSVLFVCALVVSCVLTSCQPLVQPFRPEEKTPSRALFVVKDAGGVVVREIEGMPDGTEGILANWVVAGLDQQEIPASRDISATNRRTLFLDGTVRAAPIDSQRLMVELNWSLSNTDGKTVGQHRATAEIRRDEWGKEGKQPYATLAERSVTGIAALVQDPTAQPKSASSAPDRRRFYVWPVAGAPGNGGKALSQAMSTALRAARLSTTPEMADDALVIAGSVRLMPPEKGRQRVEIVWTVLDSGGRELAKVSQGNAVPEGTLDGDWGELAQIIADAAVPSVMDLLRRLPASAEVSSTPNGG